jgi:hypothetical protein
MLIHDYGLAVIISSNTKYSTTLSMAHESSIKESVKKVPKRIDVGMNMNFIRRNLGLECRKYGLLFRILYLCLHPLSFTCGKSG